VELNCEVKPSSKCGSADGLICYRCGNDESFDGYFVFNRVTGFFIGVLHNAMENTKYEIRTDGNDRDAQSQFRYRGVSMKDVTISVDGIPVPAKAGIPVTLEPNERRLAVREANAPVRSAEALPTKRTDVDRAGRALASDEGSVVDLLYFFSYRAACQWLDRTYPCKPDATDQSNLENMVGLINAYGNDALTNSNIPTSFNVVKVHIDLAHDEGTSISPVDRLYWVRESLVARNLRDEYNADLVVDVFYFSFSFNGALGIGFVPAVTPDRSVGFTSSAGNTFSVLNQVITHEIGHNFGANHDRFVQGGGVNDESFYGYINCDTCFKTIMAYSNKCSGQCYVNTIPYFSNPVEKYQNLPMGDNANNNVLQLTSSAPGVAINRYTSSKSIFSSSFGYFPFALKALKFDIVPKVDLILKNIELEVTNDMDISVYIVAGSYADPNLDWGSPIVRDTLSPLSKLNSKLSNVASYVSFQTTPLNANQVYAIRIERNDSDQDERMEIAPAQNDGDYMENNDVTVKSGRMVNFSGNQYTNIVGLRGGLIYETTTSPITPSPTSSPKTSNPTLRPTPSPSLDPTAAPVPAPTAAPVRAPTAAPIGTDSCKDIKKKNKCNRNPNCIYGSKRIGVCTIKRERFDICANLSKTECTKGNKNRNSCIYDEESKSCKHKCLPSLEKSKCRKERICKYTRQTNPCKGCRSNTCGK